MAKKYRRKSRKKENKGLFYCIKRRYIKFLHRIRPLSICTLCVTIFCAIWHLYNNIKIAYPQKERTTIFSDDYNGIDVSKYQGKIDWEKVASDPKIQFVYIKATEGARQVDNKYHDYVDDARKEGLKIGSYHYFIGRKPAKDQFRNFKKHIDKHTQDLIPMVDVEEAGNSSISRDELQRKLPVRHHKLHLSKERLVLRRKLIILVEQSELVFSVPFSERCMFEVAVCLSTLVHDIRVAQYARIPRFPEIISDGLHPIAERHIPVAPVIMSIDYCLMHPRHHSRAAWRAYGSRTARCAVYHPLLNHPVQVRRTHRLHSVTLQVLSHILRHNPKDIGLLLNLSGSRHAYEGGCRCYFNFSVHSLIDYLISTSISPLSCPSLTIILAFPFLSPIRIRAVAIPASAFTPSLFISSMPSGSVISINSS